VKIQAALAAVLAVLAAELVAAIGAADAAAAEVPRRPNVVFFLVDDLGWTDLGCYGSTFYETPHLDRLAASGMRFTQAYAACPVCSPTRASILTGKYPQRPRITDYISPNRDNQPEKWKRVTRLLPAPYADRLPLDEFTLAEAFHEAGYATFLAGKWHLGPKGYYPEDQGFDVNRGGWEWGNPRYGNKYFSPYGNPRLSDGPPGEYLTDRLAAETAAFIEAHRDQPFFVYFSFYSVHTPLMAPEARVKKYEAKAKALKHDRPEFGQEGENRIRLVQSHPVYAAMIESTDKAVGAVLDKLEKYGLADRTIIVFTSDNGGLSTSEAHPTSNRPLRGGKGWLYEGGIREPLLVRAPGVTRPGSTCDDVVFSTDYYPTLLELAGLPARPASSIDGRSAAPLLRGEHRGRGPVFWHYPHYGNQGGTPGGAVRDGDWKLIEWYEDGRRELFNLRDDISETRDRSAELPEKTRALAASLAAWRRQVGAVMPSPRKR
jgi:arylsulfatase A-like enzyme